MLYVRKEKIQSLYPLFASNDPKKDDIRKFETLGTRPFFIEQAIGKAIEFHEMIGAQRKEERLLYLKNYWMSRVKDLPGVKLGTSMHAKFSGAIGLISIEGRKPVELDIHLFDNYKIHVSPIEWPGISGVRITPNVYTLTNQLDLLVEGIQSFVKKPSK
jgi:selenocysteine lyase/cysteine desulfurase